MIIIDSVSPVEHGRGSVRSIYTLYADTMDEVPLTGAETKPLISGLEDDLPPTTLLYTGDYQIAVLDTYDHWRWKSESEDDTNVFYVYHSGRPAASAIETVHITPYIEENGYDLTRNRTKGTYYGGYALASGVTPSNDAYDGSNWTWTTMETASGTAITPTAGVTYYVKEAPHGYLRVQLHGGMSGGKVTSLTALSGIDDLHPERIGIKINDDDYETGSAYSSYKVGGTTYTVNSAFSKYGVNSGYMYCITYTNIAKYLVEGNTIKFFPFWETPDGVRVDARAGQAFICNDLNTSNVLIFDIPDSEVGI